MLKFEAHIQTRILSSPHASAISLALSNSPFAARLIQKHPDWLDNLISNITHNWDRAQLDALLAQLPHGNVNELKQSLRLIRNQVMLRVLVQDVGKLIDLNEVMLSVTLLADFSIQVALNNVTMWNQKNYGTAAASSNGKVCELTVIAMGKLGGGELNVSSDIDIFFAYSFEGNTHGGENTLSHQDYFNKIAKQFIHILDDVTEDGFVFRVDTRLRPFGRSGQLVCSFDMLEHYYQTHGRDWERYALIKARIITGNDESRLLRTLKPFVFRKYLDFNAIDALRNLKAQILIEVNRRGMRQNIKLGPGGIREIEFIIQAFQLIRGGRQVRLQTPSTLAALAEIEQLGLLDQNTCRNLRDAYVFLRNIEHRIQYDQDRQIHTVPEDSDERSRLLCLSEFKTWEQFIEKLDLFRNSVSEHFEILLKPKTPFTLSNDFEKIWLTEQADPELINQLAQLGYQAASDIHKKLQQIKSGRRYRSISDSSKIKFDQLAQFSIKYAADTSNPDRALIRSMDLLEKLSGRSNYLSLFLEHPKALQKVHDLVCRSPYIAQVLTQFPLLLDTLLDDRLLYPSIQQETLESELHNRLHDIERYDVELQMDLLREFKQSHVFKVAAQEISNIIPLLQISDALSLLADTILQFVLRLAWRQMKLDYPAKFLVVAYGKLGSREMSYGSDLDIVFLFDDSEQGSMQDYIRYSQRINHWLSTFTSFGVLYQTDLRLRPDGSKGLLAIPINSFESYQNNRAWIWEHQALTKARWVAGDPDLGEKFNTIRHNILSKTRNINDLKKELLSMRQRIRKTKPSTISLGNVKNIAGGIIDIEFMVQYIILSNSNQYPDLIRNDGNIALLQSAAKIGIISRELADQTAHAYQSFRQITHNNLLLDPDINQYSTEQIEQLSQPGIELWNMLFAD